MWAKALPPNTTCHICHCGGCYGFETFEAVADRVYDPGRLPPSRGTPSTRHFLTLTNYMCSWLETRGPSYNYHPEIRHAMLFESRHIWSLSLSPCDGL